MNKKKKFKLSALALVMVVMSNANAANFSYNGNISFQNDVVKGAFTLLTDATNVRVWTDSFQSGTNFDPYTVVWKQAGSAWNLVAQNDDNPNIAPGQTWYDSGFAFNNLSAGNYLFSITTSPNFIRGSTLADGFMFDGQTPISLSSSHTGTFWQIHLSGVDNSTTPVVISSPVPEADTYALMLAGLGLLGFMSRRQKTV